MTAARPLAPLLLAPMLALSLLTACGSASDPQAANGAQPAAPARPVEPQGVHSFKIGDLQAYALEDGGLDFVNDTKVFGLGQKPEDVSALLTAAGLPTEKLSVDIHPLLVKAGDKVLLFDTGAGRAMGGKGGKLSASMAAAGIDPASVTDIFISHSHGDHVGGLTDAAGALAFPNAVIHMSAPEWAYLQSQAGKQASAAALVAAIRPKVVPFAPGADILPGVVQAVEIKGHTPGHSGFRIGAGVSDLLYVGDAVHHFVISVRKPDWPIAFDQDQATGAASRRALLQRSAATHQRLYAGHFPFPGIGTVQTKGDGFVWIAEPPAR